MPNAVQRAKAVGCTFLLVKKLKPLNNNDTMQVGGTIPHSRGVFMRDGLPSFVKTPECGVANLDSESGAGSHWVCYHTRPNASERTAVYFDSFGLDPPKEVVSYLARAGVTGIKTQTFRLQGADDVVCGHLCLHVLRELTDGKKI